MNSGLPLSPSQILYQHYADQIAQDAPETAEAFAALESMLKPLSTIEKEQILQAVCSLCQIHEQLAFEAGLRMGIQLYR